MPEASAACIRHARPVAKKKTRRQPIGDMLDAHVWMRSTAARRGEWDATSDTGKPDPVAGGGLGAAITPPPYPRTPPRRR